MKLISNLECEVKSNWVIHYAIFECPHCENYFKANVSDVKRNRVKSCGCIKYLFPLEKIVNGCPVVKDLGLIDGNRTAVFECICKNTFTARVTNVRSSKTKKHCGCLTVQKKVKEVKAKIPKERTSLVHVLAKKYNKSYTEVLKLNYTWKGMIQRCYCVTHKKYIHYGYRGISVCDAWRTSFEQFIIDMGFKPDQSLSIDRINNNGNYEPNNCRWATIHQQNNNTRKNKVLLG